MRSQSTSQANMSALSDFTPTAVLCNPSDAERVSAFVESSPILLPKGSNVFIEIDGKKVTISSPAGIRQVRIARSSDSVEVEATPGSFRISGVAGYREVEVMVASSRTPSGATSIASAGVPLTLLDEYARLSGKSGRSPSEEQRLAELPQAIRQKVIADDGARTARRASLSSVPQSTGESYGGSMTSRGGG